MIMNAFRSLLPLLVLCIGTVPAQPNPGDYILGDLGSRGIFSIDRVTGAVSTVATGFTTGFINWVVMDFNNSDMVAVSGTNYGALYRVTRTGTIITVAAVPGNTSPNGIEVDEDGTYVVSGSDSVRLSILVRITGGGAVSSVLPGAPNFLNNVIIDRDDGDYMLALFRTGLLLKTDRSSLAVTTLTSGMGNVSAVDFDPRTGNYVVSSFGPSRCFIIDKTGTTVTSFSLPHDHAVKVDDEAGTLHAAGFNGAGEYSMTGVAIKTFGPHSPMRWTSLDVYGSRKVSGSGPGMAGTTYTLHFSFPLSGPGATYIGALSLAGQHPGIQVPGGRRINLVPDNLTFLMLRLGNLPGLTSGFLGTLGVNASALALIHLPRFVPPGIRIFATAVAVNMGMPGKLDVADTWAFTTQ